MKTTIVIDFSVAAHQLHRSIVESAIDRTHYEGVVKAQMVWMMSCAWLGDLKPAQEDVSVVMVMDSKPYWRTEYLTRPEVYEAVTDRKPTPIHYKGGRKFPEKSFTKLKKDMERIAAAQGWQMLRLSGYEADDMAAAIVQVNRGLSVESQHKLWLITVDTDWLGLVDDNTHWFCMHGWHPRVRANLAAVNVWSIKRLKKSFARPKDIWTYKAAYGDKSDNLPKNTPPEVIDLLNPPEEHKLWTKQPMQGIINKMLVAPSTPKLADVSKATEYLRLMGIPRFIKPYKKETEV